MKLHTELTHTVTISLWLLHLNRSGLFDRQRRPRGEGRSAPPDHARPAYFRAGGAKGGPMAVRIVLCHTLQDDVLWPERRRRDQLPALWAGEERGGVESMDALRRSPRRVSGQPLFSITYMVISQSGVEV